MVETNSEPHVVIVGWDEFSRLITQRLCKSDIPVAIITSNSNDLPKIQEEFDDKGDVEAIHRELTSYKTFTDVNIEESMRVFVNRASDDDSLISILNMKKHYEGLDFVAVLQNDELKQTFENAGVTYAVSKFVIASKIVTSFMYESDVAELEFDLLAGTEEGTEDQHDLQQYLITDNSKFIGEKYIDVFWEIKNEHNCIPVGLSQRQDDHSRKLIKDPDDDLILSEGDYVLIIVNAASEEKLVKTFGVSEGLNESKL